MLDGPGKRKLKIEEFVEGLQQSESMFVYTLKMIYKYKLTKLLLILLYGNTQGPHENIYNEQERQEVDFQKAFD